MNHPAVVAINGESRVLTPKPGNVEFRFGAMSKEQLDRIAETPAYLEFEQRIIADGWPEPVEPLALLRRKDGEGIISGVFTYLAAKRLHRERIPVVFLAADEVPVWQSVVQRPTPRAANEDDDFAQRVRAFYG